MNKVRFSLVCLSTVVLYNAQEKDSLKSKNIDEVVITGQFNAQSIDKSIYKVEVIDQQQIKNSAATTVAEVLNQNLNMMIVPDSGSGDSQANIMGLGGEYTKVLIDNIPVVNDQGLGNSFDLTKINLNNVDKIEIVKGSMGVEYGNNAVVGVINIITKKGSAKKISGSASLQEETVGKDYDWYKKGNGRHVQNLDLGYNINDHWYVSADINHNDFQGFKGKQKGYKYFSEDLDLLRGYEWQPKDQLNVNGLIRYSKNKTSFFYKLSFLNEEINFKNEKIEPKTFAGGQRTFYANDRDYFTKRWVHQFNIQTQFGNVQYSGDFSYQTQNRNYEDFLYDVPARKEVSRNDKYTYYDTEVYYSRGMFSNFLNNEKFDFRLGYELDYTNGFASPEAIENNNKDNLQKTVFTYSNFLSAEWQVTNGISLRPGVRLALSDKFDQQYNYSLTSKFVLNKNSDLRTVIGSANRFPGYEELYAYFVNDNHDIRGNENLKPEKGFSAGIFWDYKNNDRNILFSLSGLYLNVKDRIEQAITGFDPKLQYRYINVDSYHSFLFGGNFQYKRNNFTFNSGISLMGISKQLVGLKEVSPQDYYFYPEVNASATYKLNAGTLFALFYKYSGTSKQIVMDQDIQGNSTFRVGEIGDYNMMNFTVSQPFVNNHLELALGIKNIFNVSDITNTTTAATPHADATSSLNYFYGRSYFARLSYNF